MDGLIDVVDENNVVIGQEWMSVVHKKGLWHRLVVVYVFNENGQLFVQKRSEKVPTAKGLWDHSCAGHVDVGEAPVNAAKRELEEELGIKTKKLELIKEYKSILGEEVIDGKTLNRFWYLYKIINNGPFNLDPDEVSEGKFVNVDWLSNDIKNNTDIYTKGFIKSLNQPPTRQSRGVWAEA